MLTSVHRYFSLFGLHPHRTETFKLSTVLLFIESLHDVVGLYLNPPKKHACSVQRREEPMPGTRAKTANLADGAELRRGRHAR